jgi:hypothetical protein
MTTASELSLSDVICILKIYLHMSEGMEAQHHPAGEPILHGSGRASDAVTTMLYLFLRRRSAVYMQKVSAGGFDAGWRHLPATEVEGLIGLLREEA